MTDKLKQRAIDLYQGPFEYMHGYIFDANNEMVSDDSGGDAPRIARVRGWGAIQKLPEAEALQDQVGELIAEALTEYWAKHGK